MLPLADACRFLEKEAPQLLQPHHLGRAGRPLWLQGIRAEVRREPLGVVLIIGPSNYPLFLPGVQTLQALAAGNAVLLKPGSGGGPVAQRFAELLYDAGLKEPLLNVLSEDPDDARHACAQGVDKVFLTGSAQTGVEVLTNLADTLTPAVVELSGCDAAFVLPDADLDLVARALSFAFRLKTGQTCIAPRRLLVAEELAGDLEKRLVVVARELAPQLVPARPAPATAWLIADAVKRGARLCAGQVSADDHVLGPVVLADVTPEMPLLREEVFAPVVALLAVRDTRRPWRPLRIAPMAWVQPSSGRNPAPRPWADASMPASSSSTTSSCPPPIRGFRSGDVAGAASVSPVGPRGCWR